MRFGPIKLNRLQYALTRQTPMQCNANNLQHQPNPSRLPSIHNSSIKVLPHPKLISQLLDLTHIHAMIISPMMRNTRRNVRHGGEFPILGIEGYPQPLRYLSSAPYQTAWTHLLLETRDIAPALTLYSCHVAINSPSPSLETQQRRLARNDET